VKAEAKIGLFLAIGAGAVMVAKIASKKKEYTPTAEDKLWLQRAVEVEGPPKEMVARALVNLFVWQFSKERPKYKTLHSLVRAYAQPVNPRWFDDGDLFKQSLAKKKTDKERNDALKAAQKRREVHSRRTTFAPDTTEAVEKALAYPWPSDITDYAAPFVDASHKYERRTESRPGVNTFWSRAPGWEGYRVTDTGSLTMWG
jgi:hypothetical protein